MIRVIRIAALLGAAGALLGSTALAGIPTPVFTYTNLDPANPGKNIFIAVVGQNDAGLPDPCTDGRCGDFVVTVRDQVGNVIAGVTVVLDFSGCPDIQLSCNQLNAVTGQTYLAGKKVAGTTNAVGEFRFKIQGASNSTSTQSPPFVSPGTGAGVACVRVYGDGILAPTPLTPSAYDVDGLGSVVSAAVNAADVAKVKIEALLSGTLGSRARADYNYDAAVNAADVGISAKLALTPPAQGSVKTTTAPDGSYCP